MNAADAQALIRGLDKDAQIDSLVRQIADQSATHARVVAQMDAVVHMNAQVIAELRQALAEKDQAEKDDAGSTTERKD